MLLPASNEKDLRGLPDTVRAQMRITTTRSMDEVIELMLLPPLAITRDADRPTFETRRRHGTDARDNAAGGGLRDTDVRDDDSPGAPSDDAWPS